MPAPKATANIVEDLKAFGLTTAAIKKLSQEQLARARGFMKRWMDSHSQIVKLGEKGSAGMRLMHKEDNRIKGIFLGIAIAMVYTSSERSTLRQDHRICSLCATTNHLMKFRKAGRPRHDHHRA